MAKISNIGAIQTMTIPENWVDYKDNEGPGRRTTRRLAPYDAVQVTFQSIVRGVELSHPAREAFARVLYEEFHPLEGNEIKELREVLEGVANPEAFRIDQAWTAYLNSRRVIAVRGEWIKFKLKEASYFLDVTGKSLYVQQLSFSAPSKEFANVYEDFERESLLSIEWARQD
jgi:hypothetical protein